MATGEIRDPYGNYRFLLEADDLNATEFAQVSGLDSTIDIIEYREGGNITTSRKLPGLTRYSNIVLRWGITDDMELFTWHRDAVKGVLKRRNGSVNLLGSDGQVVACWNFVRAWPCKYIGPELNAEGNDVAIEVLELAHEGIERVYPVSRGG